MSFGGRFLGIAVNYRRHDDRCLKVQFLPAVDAWHLLLTRKAVEAIEDAAVIAAHSVLGGVG